jgi:cell division transport system permease protein
LFLAGFLSLIFLYTSKITNHVKENLSITLVLKPGSSYAQVINIENLIKDKEYIRKISFIPPEKAAKEMEEELGRDFITVLGYNPLLPTLEIFLKPEFTNNESIIKLGKEFQTLPGVQDVNIQTSMIETINAFARKISLIFILLLALLLVVVYSLIYQSVKLSVHAQRFVIKTMQLVGSTAAYIRRPFLFNALFNGITGSLVGVILVSSVLFSIRYNMPEIVVYDDIKSWIVLAVLLILTGILISFLSTVFVVRRLINTQPEQLH